jgi:hypothetical protein
MRKTTLVVVALLLLAAVAGADDKSDAVASVRKFFDSFNKGEAKTAVAFCKVQSPVVDEFPPYAWPSCAEWASAFAAFAKKNGMTDGMVKMSDPRDAEVNGNRAYVVVPVTFSYLKGGKQVKEPDATFTAALEKIGKTWLIRSWTWSR